MLSESFSTQRRNEAVLDSHDGSDKDRDGNQHADHSGNEEEEGQYLPKISVSVFNGILDSKSNI